MVSYSGYEDLSGKAWSDIKYSAKRRNISFAEDLTIEYAWNLFIKQDKKCALSNLPIEIYRDRNKRNTASLDRIDSLQGYSRDNIQWLHKDINNLKGSHSNRETIRLCRKIFLEDLKRRRPNWPEYFMEIAYLVSTRSRDPSTKCGSVFTDSNYKIISTGYNGSFQGIDDNLVSWERPNKYFHITHAEMNSLLFATVSLKNCYAFITGIPCSNCCKHMIQAGISKIYYGNNLAKMCNKEDEIIVRKLCQLKNIELIHIDI